MDPMEKPVGCTDEMERLKRELAQVTAERDEAIAMASEYDRVLRSLGARIDAMSESFIASVAPLHQRLRAIRRRR